MWFRRSESKGSQEASQALADSEKNLERVESYTEEVQEISSGSKAMREKNHFAEQVYALLTNGGNGREVTE